MWRRLLLVGTLCSLLGGQDAGAPVVVDGQEILRVYGTAGPFNAVERAAEIGHRVTLLAEKKVSERMAIRPLPSENVTVVVSGTMMVMAVTAADAEAAGVARDELAARYAEAIQRAVENYRTRRTWRNLLWALGVALTIWTLYCVAIGAVWKAFRWLDRRLADRVAEQASTRGVRGARLLVWERGRRVLMLVLKATLLICLISTFSFVISYTFSLFPQPAGVSTTLLGYLKETFGSAVMAVIHYLPSGGFVVLVCLGTYYLLKILKFVAQAIESGDLALKPIHPEMASPTYQIARIGVVLFAVVAAFPYLPGGKSDAFKGVSIFIGLLLSLGSSSAVSNVLAGLVLTYMRAFRVGDRVKIVDTTGDVLERTLLVTRVRTIKNVEVVIPNGAILTNQVLNYSAMARSQGLILNTAVTIGYNAPWRTVHALLIQAALTTDGILRQPAPFVLQTSLNDFHVSYELNAYTDRPNEFQNIYSRLHEAIQDSFNEGGIEIMSPTFYALRDGNTVTIPVDHLAPGYEAPAFRVKAVGPRAKVPDGSIGASTTEE
jgi:small-conductance mechanosensitive channel